MSVLYLTYLLIALADIPSGRTMARPQNDGGRSRSGLARTATGEELSNERH